VRLPPARSGPRMLAAVVVLMLVFLGSLWYASFTVLRDRGPDRVVLGMESWEAGTIVVVVEEVRQGGEVLLTTLNVTIRTASNVDLYDAAPGQTVELDGFNLTVEFEDTDRLQSLTRGDRIIIRADPPEKVENLILSTLYLVSDGREWSRMSLPP